MTTYRMKGMKGSKKGRQTVIPGQPDKSPLVMSVEGKSGHKMPPKKASTQPTVKEIAVLRAWVEGGAKDDTPKQSRWEGGAEKNLRTSILAMAEASSLPSGFLRFERLQFQYFNRVQLNSQRGPHAALFRVNG